MYLQPLIEELLELFAGIQTYDALSGKYFMMHAALIWTISDSPAYGDLSGWVTKGKLACPCCKDQTCFQSLRSKIGYLGHRRFLPEDHKWRRYSSKFNRKPERRPRPGELSGLEILEQLEVVKDIKLGKNPKTLKRKRAPKDRNWSKKSIFYKLPYCEHLMLPHNIDVMHTEKNWLDNLMGTFLNLKKSKDTDKARLDLEDMGIRKELHLQKKGNGNLKSHLQAMCCPQKRGKIFVNF